MAEEGLDSENLGRLGMNIVERIVLLSFRWAFRDQTMMDAGIDAHVEVKTPASATPVGCWLYRSSAVEASSRSRPARAGAFLSTIVSRSCGPAMRSR